METENVELRSGAELQARQQAVVDSDGNAVTLSLDIKSVKPYRTQDEYLYAMKEDLAEWFNALYGLPITVEDFFEQLETGVVLCQHANALQNFIAKQLEDDDEGSTGGMVVQGARNNNRYPVQLPATGVVFRSKVQAGTFQSRDNISNFISWCRGVLGIPDTLLFETEDLVSRKNERNVVLCILEVARRGASYGMLAPKLVQFEAEIDAEMENDAAEELLEEEGNDCNRNLHQEHPASKRQRPWIEVDMMSLDEMVRLILSRCTCEQQFPMVRVSEGKYRFGESLSLIFLRILRNHVMVRIGGGWDTLECFLDRYDPCRCKSKEHRGMLAFVAKSATVSTSDQKKPVTSPLSPTSPTTLSPHSSNQATSQGGDSPSHIWKGSPKRNPPAETQTPEKSLPSKTQQSKSSGFSLAARRKDVWPESKPDIRQNSPPESKPDSRRNSTPGIRAVSAFRRTPSPVTSSTGEGQPARGQGQRSRVNVLSANASTPLLAGKRVDGRPVSASPSLTRASRTFKSSGDLLSTIGASTARSVESQVDRQNLVRSGSTSMVLSPKKNSTSVANRGRTVASVPRSATLGGALRHSSSLDSTKFSSALTPRSSTAAIHEPRTKSPSNVVLSKSDAGRRTSGTSKTSASHVTRGSGRLSSSLPQKLTGFTADKLLPNYTRKRCEGQRSSSVDVSPVEDRKVLPGKEESSRLRRSASLQSSASFSLLNDLELSSPPEDENLNAKMEILYEQYRDAELGREVSDASGKALQGNATSQVSTGRSRSTSKPSPGQQGHSSAKTQPQDGSSYRSFSRKGELQGNNKQPSTRTPSTETPSSATKPVSRPATSSLERGSMSRKENYPHQVPSTRGPGKPRLSLDASVHDAGHDAGHDTRHEGSRSSSRPRSIMNKDKTLSKSRESVLGGSLTERISGQTLCKSLGDISDNRLTLQIHASPLPPDSSTKAPSLQNAPGQEKSEETTSPQTNIEGDKETVKAKPRKDDRLGPPTRIPLPVVPGDQRQSEPSFSLKRFDSGVDITNISPTGENGSYHGDEDALCHSWVVSVQQRSEASSLSDQKLVFAATPLPEDEFY